MALTIIQKANLRDDLKRATPHEVHVIYEGLRETHKVMANVTPPAGQADGRFEAYLDILSSLYEMTAVAGEVYYGVE